MATHNIHGTVAAMLNPDQKTARRGIEYFALVQRMFVFCHERRVQFPIGPQDPQKVHAAAFFAKLLRDDEAAFHLLKHGMFSQSRSMLRVAIECEIILAKCCRTPGFDEVYRLASEKERLRLLKGGQRITQGEFENVKQAIPKPMIDALADALRGTPEKIVEQWAIDVGLGDLYQTGYRLYSADIHSTTRSVGGFLEYDESGLASGVEWVPPVNDCRSEVVEILRVAINGFAHIANLFELPPDDAFIDLRREYCSVEELVETDPPE